MKLLQLIAAFFFACCGCLTCVGFSLLKIHKMNFNIHSSSDPTLAENNELQEDVVGQAPGVLPRASSKTNFGEVNLNILHDMWLVGSGTLGELIIANAASKSKLIAETRTTQRHNSIKEMGATPRLREDRKECDIGSAKTVIVCLPPSCSEDHYIEEVHAAAKLWAGPEGGGNLVYTSSIAVYGPSSGNIVNEEFRVDSRSPTSTK